MCKEHVPEERCGCIVQHDYMNFMPKGFALNCLAHSANLFMQDLAGIFEKQFDQAREVQLFFRRPRAVVAYQDCMKKDDAKLIQV